MDRKIISLKLTIAHVKCHKCGFERILYFTPDNWYGEKVVSTKDGKLCAYANLMEENVIQELDEICIDIFKKEKIDVSKNKRGRIVSQMYSITCDDIDGQKVDNTPSWNCCNCLNGEVEEDKEFGEKIMDIQMPYVTHTVWDSLDYSQKKSKVKSELINLGYKI